MGTGPPSGRVVSPPSWRPVQPSTSRAMQEEAGVDRRASLVGAFAGW